MRSRPKRFAAALGDGASRGVALPGIAAAAELDVVTVVTSPDDRTVSLVADIKPTATPVRTGSFTVRAGTANLPARAAAIFSDQLAMGLVVDASEAGGAALQSGLSGAANLLLQAPAALRAQRCRGRR